MKAKELAEQLLKLPPDFEVVFNTINDGGTHGFNVVQYKDIEVIDVGRETVILGGVDV